jgi:hypothetical protein
MLDHLGFPALAKSAAIAAGVDVSSKWWLQHRQPLLERAWGDLQEQTQSESALSLAGDACMILGCDTTAILGRLHWAGLCAWCAVMAVSAPLCCSLYASVPGLARPTRPAPEACG